MTFTIIFNDSVRFMSSLVDNLAEGIYNSKCKDYKSYLTEYVENEEQLSIFKCLKCNKSHRTYFSKGLVKRFAHTHINFVMDILISFA